MTEVRMILPEEATKIDNRKDKQKEMLVIWATLDQLKTGIKDHEAEITKLKKEKSTLKSEVTRLKHKLKGKKND